VGPSAPAPTTSGKATSETWSFPTGLTLGADGDTINPYYGAADTSIALAPNSLRRIFDWLESNGEPVDAAHT
jgi:hypothetical protein